MICINFELGEDVCTHGVEDPSDSEESEFKDPR